MTAGQITDKYKKELEDWALNELADYPKDKIDKDFENFVVKGDLSENLKTVILNKASEEILTKQTNDDDLIKWMNK